MKAFLKSGKAKLLVIGILLAALIMSFNPINIYINSNARQSNSKILNVGNQRLILTIGNIAHATGTLDYAWNGVNDNVNVAAAIAVLNSHGGGELVMMTENYTFLASVNVPANITIRGLGASTNISFNGVNPVFVATGANVKFIDFATDAGGVNMGATTGWKWDNLKIGATNYNTNTADSLAKIGTTDVVRFLKTPPTGFGRPNNYSRQIPLMDVIVMQTKADESLYLQEENASYGYEYRYGPASAIDTPGGEGRWAVGSYRNGSNSWVVLETENYFSQVFATGITANPPSWALGGLFAVPVMKLGSNTTQGRRYITVYEPIITPEAEGGIPALVYTDPTSITRAIQVSSYVAATAPNGQANIGIMSAVSTNTSSNANVTGLWSAFYGKVLHQATAGTMSSASAFYAEVPTVSAGKTITDYVGVNIPALTGWAGTITNAYGVKIGNVTGGGTVNWGLYNAGKTWLGSDVTLNVGARLSWSDNATTPSSPATVVGWLPVKLPDGTTAYLPSYK